MKVTLMCRVLALLLICVFTNQSAAGTYYQGAIKPDFPDLNEQSAEAAIQLTEMVVQFELIFQALERNDLSKAKVQHAIALDILRGTIDNYITMQEKFRDVIINIKIENAYEKRNLSDLERIRARYGLPNPVATAGDMFETAVAGLTEFEGVLSKWAPDGGNMAWITARQIHHELLDVQRQGLIVADVWWQDR